MKGVEAVAEVLRREGVEYLFCFPNNPLIEAAAELGIRPIMTRTERTLINMADGYTRAHNARKIGVCCVQGGPGIENAFGGVAQAGADATPLLMLPGQQGRGRMDVPATFRTLEVYRPVTKWAAQINMASRVPELMRRAFTALRTAPYGPVLLEMPGDVASEEIAELRYAPARGLRAGGDPVAVREAARLVVGAGLPLLIAGHGVLYAEASDELRELAELLQAPVMSTMAGKSAFPENHPLAAGAAGATGTDVVRHYLKESDLVVGVGTSLGRGSFRAAIPGGKTMVQLTANATDVGVDYPIDCAVLGDVKLTLQQLVEEVKTLLGADGRRGDDVRVKEVAGLRSAWIETWLPKLTSNETPINPYRVIWDLNQALDRTNAMITHDSGNPRDQMLPFFEAIIPRGYLGWGKSTQLGFGLGLAMGAKLAQPDRTVVNVMGDAAFGMAGLDIESAARSGIGTLTVILNNGALGGYDKYLPVATEKYGTRFLSGDYVKVTEGLGAWSERVEQPSELIPAIKRAEQVTRGGRPAVLEVITREEGAFEQTRTR